MDVTEQIFEACAPDGVCRVVRWPLERVAFHPKGLKYKTFAIGEQLTAADLNPRTNIDALVAGGHLRPVADEEATQPQEDEEAD